MHGHSTFEPKNGSVKWLEARLPILSFMHGSFVAYPTPKNLNYWWTFGAILVLHAGRADRHRHRAGHALHAERDAGLRLASRRSCAT